VEFEQFRPRSSPTASLLVSRTSGHVSGRPGALVDYCSEAVADGSSSDDQVAAWATKQVRSSVERAPTFRARRVQRVRRWCRSDVRGWMKAGLRAQWRRLPPFDPDADGAPASRRSSVSVGDHGACGLLGRTGSARRRLV
jgi:hypothetical protein